MPSLPNGPTRSTAKRSIIFEVGDIVRVPFPFVERDRLQARPALIISRPVGAGGLLQWSVMITSAQRGSWPGDISTGSGHAEFGLPVPCFIRTAKIAALEVAAIERRLGRVSSALLEQVCHELRLALGWL